MEVTRDVPVPVATNASGINTGIAPTIRKLELNESFAVPYERRKSLQFALWNERKRPINEGKRFLTRTVEEDGVKVTRCWRVE